MKVHTSFHGLVPYIRDLFLGNGSANTLPRKCNDVTTKMGRYHVTCFLWAVSMLRLYKWANSLAEASD
jgi:hypothetical protein